MLETDVTLVIPCIGMDCVAADRLVPWIPCSWQIIKERSYGAAIKEGITQATTPLVATMDADGQHMLQDLPRLYQEIQRGKAAMVIGTRTTPQTGPRALSSALLNFAASALVGKPVPDFGSGLRIFERSTALRFMHQLPTGFDFNAALTMSFLAHDYPVTWIPATVHKRQWGKSHVKLRDGFVTLKTLWHTRPRSMS